MSVIDTLITILKVDSKEFTKAMSDADQKSEELTKELTDGEKAVKRFEDSFINLAKNVAAGAAALLTVSSIVSGFKEAGASAIELRNLSIATNSSMGEISAWGHATVEAGGDASSFQSSVKGLNDSIQELALTGDSSAAPAMRALGLNFLDGSRRAKPLTQNLLDIAGAMEGMDRMKQIEIGKRLGLDQGTIFLLMKGKLAVGELLKKKREMGALDEKNAEAAISYNVVMDEFRTRMEHVYMGIGSTLVPAFNMILKSVMGLADFFGRHTPLLVASLGLVAVGLWSLVAPLVAGAVAWIAMAWPIIAAVAAFVALGLILGAVADDLYNFFTGGQSVIGDFLNTLDKFWDWITTNFPLIGAIMKAVFETALLPLNLLLAALEQLVNLGKVAYKFLFQAESADTNGQTNNSISNGGASSVTHNTISATAHVSTMATDAAGVAKHVGSNLSGMIRSAIGQSDDGVEA